MKLAAYIRISTTDGLKAFEEEVDTKIIQQAFESLSSKDYEGFSKIVEDLHDSEQHIVKLLISQLSVIAEFITQDDINVWGAHAKFSGYTDVMSFAIAPTMDAAKVLWCDSII